MNLSELPLPALYGDGGGGSKMQARTALCVDCTNGWFAFLGSPFPQLLPHM